MRVAPIKENLAGCAVEEVEDTVSAGVSRRARKYAAALRQSERGQEMRAASSRGCVRESNLHSQDEIPRRKGQSQLKAVAVFQEIGHVENEPKVEAYWA